MARPDTNDYQSIFLQDLPLIDTRAPIEFSKGAFPSAQNLPLMSDSERHQVGIRYKEAGQEAAIALGRELVDKNLQAQRTTEWLEFAHANPNGYLYCFRGGLRSRITQSWMAEAGTHYPYIKGGYKAMRRYLITSLEENIRQTPLILIGGRTGSGKTELLKALNHHIDLEGLAAHRGSSFGLLTVPQPSPINFENSLAIEFLKQCHRQNAPLFLEAEGRLIGSISLPLPLWEKMCRSPVVVLERSLEERIQIGLNDYVRDLIQRLRKNLTEEQAILQLGERHKQSLNRIRKRFGGVRHEKATKLLDAAVALHLENNDLSAYEPFIALLLKEYYDPMYDYQQRKRGARILFQGNATEILEWTEATKFHLIDNLSIA